ncbi:MAG: hypothetical protein QOI25_2302, partial [Mycobacterium sp.]|nr:hypothetical protein [Mycobacterium sp.]
RGGEQIFCVGIPVVHRQHLPGQRRCDRPITTVDRRHRTIKQVIDRHTGPCAGIAVSPGPQQSIAHVKIIPVRGLFVGALAKFQPSGALVGCSWGKWLLQAADEESGLSLTLSVLARHRWVHRMRSASPLGIPAGLPLTAPTRPPTCLPVVIGCSCGLPAGSVCWRDDGGRVCRCGEPLGRGPGGHRFLLSAGVQPSGLVPRTARSCSVTSVCTGSRSQDRVTAPRTCSPGSRNSTVPGAAVAVAARGAPGRNAAPSPKSMPGPSVRMRSPAWSNSTWPSTMK